MERIVQLNQAEYDNLVKAANLTKEEIKKRAKKIYEEKGVLGVEVELNINETYNETFELKSYGRQKGDWNNILIPYEKKRELITLVQEKAKVLFLNFFKNELQTMNDTKKILCQARAERNRFKVFTLTGWLMALMMMALLILKITQ